MLGTTSTGYGAGLVSGDVSAGRLITTSSYYALIDDHRRCWIHQTGGLDGFPRDQDLPKQQDRISSSTFDILLALSNTVTTNAYITPHDSQLSQDALASSTSTIYNGNALTYRVDYTFADRKNANYFFNLGGSISAGLAHGTYVVNNTATSWAGFIDWADNEISSIGYAREQWIALASINTSYTSGTNLVSLGIFAVSNNTSTTVTSILTVTNTIDTVNVPTTATSYLTYSVEGPAVQEVYYGVASPRPQASIITSFGSGQTPPIIPTKILTVSQPGNFTLPYDSNSNSQTVTITNSGNTTCTITSIVFDNAFVPYYFIADIGNVSFPQSIGPGSHFSFDLTYYLGDNGFNLNIPYNINFYVYSDANDSPAIISTQLTVVTPAFDFYLDPSSWDYTYTRRDNKTITLPVTVKGKGSFSSITYGTDTNFLSSGFSIRDSLTVVGFDITFDPTIPPTNNTTYATTVDIGINSITHPFTATITLSVPPAPTTTHLGQWISAYQRDNGVIGASYDIINDVRYITLGFGMGADGGSIVAPTQTPPYGVNVNINNLGLGANADGNFLVGPVLYPSTGNVVHSNFLNPYDASTNLDGHGVWVNDSGWSPTDVFVSRTFTFNITQDGFYAYKFAADNQAYFTIGGVIVGDLRNSSENFSPVQDFFQLSTGVKTLTIYFYNSNNGHSNSVENPGAVALTITEQRSGNIVWDSNWPIRTGYTAYQYWNEVYRIPLYDSTLTDAIYYSKDYIIKNLNPLNNYSYGSWFGDTGSVEQGSMFTITQDHINNDITIKLNSKSSREINDKTTNYASYLFYYYTGVLGTEDRLTQLESNRSDGQTLYFTGFKFNGTTSTALLSQPTAPYVPPVVESSGGGGGGGGCPDPNTPILVSEGGYTCPAGELIVGDMVWTRHEISGLYDSYPVTAVEIVQQSRVSIQFDDGTDMIVSDTHKFLMCDLTWKQVFQMTPGDAITGIDISKSIVSLKPLGVGPVVKITVDQAHTYIAGGLISHNVKSSSYTNEVLQ